jgi:hypothetical protein
MAEINGLRPMSPSQLASEVRNGARFVVFEYCVSVLVMTFKRDSAIHYVEPGDSAWALGLPYTLLTLLLGWWGFPWGIVYTPAVLLVNLSGGRDVTAEVLQALVPAPHAPASPRR